MSVPRISKVKETVMAKRRRKGARKKWGRIGAPKSAKRRAFLKRIAHKGGNVSRKRRKRR